MPKYKVTATSMTTLFVEIEAKNKEEAWKKGCEMDGGYFEESGSDWEMSDVYLIEGEEPKEEDETDDEPSDQEMMAAFGTKLHDAL